MLSWMLIKYDKHIFQVDGIYADNIRIREAATSVGACSCVKFRYVPPVYRHFALFGYNWIEFKK